MFHKSIEEIFELTDVEVETVRRAALVRRLRFDPEKRLYTRDQLRGYGVVREAYTSDELRELGYSDRVVTSHDSAAEEAKIRLRVDTPFAAGIMKWQLPIDMREVRVLQVIFPAASTVTPHVHHENEPGDPGGSLRIVTKGYIKYRNEVFGPGDWFYVPNGVSYSFNTDPTGETHVMYLYRFFAGKDGNRFSHPSAVNHGDSMETVADGCAVLQHEEQV
ncbi:hypothetical protein [Microvirga lotononidis]|uniref:Cupin domain-containing protein n=1 Tax=Microvirga lotononidis TaxID=864069 RepID=I4Z0X5_9HYPH|nr:hypothetical protein [Microvirga lotononidis]EIM29867.1 hypothetical protein MicloDRAFT_00011870 [Microvirga lotononidis]WQO31050.1 hypothetical protein U0023_32585 [Microvirga lotononidis]